MFFTNNLYFPNFDIFLSLLFWCTNLDHLWTIFGTIVSKGSNESQKLAKVIHTIKEAANHSNKFSTPEVKFSHFLWSHSPLLSISVRFRWIWFLLTFWANYVIKVIVTSTFLKLFPTLQRLFLLFIFVLMVLLKKFSEFSFI